MSVFVDTSAIYALLDRDDESHLAAAEAFASLENEAFLTHNYVVVECATLVQRRLGSTGVRAFVDDLLPAFELAWIDAHLHEEATAALIASRTKTISLVDWTSFQLMRQRGIERAFAFDKDFVAHGFSVVP